MPLAKPKFVLFADLLGFAALTEAYPRLDTEQFEMLDRPEHLDFLQVAFHDAKANMLAMQYAKFQLCLSEAIAEAQKAHDLTSIAFSDSAFIAAPEAADVISLSRQLIRQAIKSGVPMRMGIGYGSFMVLRFKADVSLTGGEHSAQFLGTAVVRAYSAAEKSRIKGMRILVHPSAHPALEKAQGQRFEAQLVRYLNCAPEESENAVGVALEVDYSCGDAQKDAELIHRVLEMKGQSPASESAHYDATLKAFGRMYQARHKTAPPLTT